MGRKKKDQRHALAELLGIEAPTTNPYEDTEDVSREAEATLAYADSPESFIRKDCKICGRSFAHTRGAVAYCSNRCRASGLEAIGIKWSWTKTAEERWAPWQSEPLVVPPDALALLDELMPTAEPEPEPEPPAPETDSVLDLLAELGLD